MSVECGSVRHTSSLGCTPRSNKSLERYFNGKIRSAKFTKMAEFDLAREAFAPTTVIMGIQTKPQHLCSLRSRALISNASSSILFTRTWLFVKWLLSILGLLSSKIIPALGAVGLPLGYPSVASSFSSVLSPASKTILVVTMLMGRHRGPLASLKDQEVIEMNAANSFNRWPDELINAYEHGKLVDIEPIGSDHRMNVYLFHIDRNINIKYFVLPLSSSFEKNQQRCDKRKSRMSMSIIKNFLSLSLALWHGVSGSF